ncbi:MAG: hypothetical protein H7330_03950 [Hymenobacteraceae bacterium]|nr:hypothetical protein [Hymenobacteraceae bacterium]
MRTLSFPLTSSGSPAADRSALAALLVGLAFAVPVVAVAQPGGRSDSRLEDTEIVIEKSRTNELPPASRNFEQLRIPPPPPVKKEVKYDFRDFKIPDRPLPVTPRPAPLRQETTTPVPGLYLEAGFGNYGTPYGRLGAHTKPSTNFRAGIDARHQSSSTGPVDGKNSGGSNTAASAEGEFFSKAAAVGARAGFERSGTFFYGYAPARGERLKSKTDSLEQIHTRINAEVFLRTTDVKRPFQAEVVAGVRTWQNSDAEKETDINGRLNLGFGLDETNRFTIRTDVSNISYESFAKQTRMFGQSTLAFEHDGSRFDATLGAAVGYTNDTLNQAKKFNVYPAVRISTEIIESRLVVFAGAGGGLERTTLYSLTRENPWLAGSRVEAPLSAAGTQPLGLAVADVNRQISLYGGLSGSPARAVRVLGRVSYNRFRNLYFYNPRAVDSVRYALTYAVHPNGSAAGLTGKPGDGDRTPEEDQPVTNLNIHGEVTVDVGQKVQVAIKVDADTWTADSLRQPYHRPAYQASLTSSFAIGEKLRIAPEAYVIGSSYGLGSGLHPDATGARRLRQTDTVIDVNLRADYQITPQFRIFALGQNLTGQNYQRFLNYPVRGLTVIGGLGYQF